MFLIFSYEIFCVVEEDVFKPVKEGMGELLLFAIMARSGILKMPNLALIHYVSMSPE